MGIHQDQLGRVTDVGAVGVDPEDELALAVIGGKAVAGEEERALANGQMGLLCAYELIFPH